MKAPFPWFGGKSRAARQVWRALGCVENYIEPFGGSAALLLARPGGAAGVETYNDNDGLLVNAWRSMQMEPEATAAAADWPVSEADLHARHLVLVEARESLTERLISDPDWCDPRLGGWWIWGACCWIGSGWCSGDGPWSRDVDGLLHLGDAGMGINRKLPHLGDAGRGINRQLPHLGAGMGINRQLPHLGDAGRGDAIASWFSVISSRLRDVRIVCGSWERVCTPTVAERHGLTGIVFDPPYPEGWSTDRAYAGQTESAHDICAQVFGTAIDLDSRGCRVVVCGYSGTWSPPAGWTERRWTARKGYAADGGMRQKREVLWCSPLCVGEDQPGLFS